jgi:hypothetical protein
MDAHRPTQNLSKQIAADLDVRACVISLRGRPVQASDRTAGDLEDWQFVLSDGPSYEAFSTGRTVERYSHQTYSRAFGDFSEHMTAAEIASVTAFPLLAGSERLGVMTLYASVRDPLQDRKRAHAEGSARRVTAAVKLDLLDWAVRRDLVTSEFEMATGWVMERSALSANDAAAAIRAHAYATNTPLRELCHQILGGRLDDDLWTAG